MYYWYLIVFSFIICFKYVTICMLAIRPSTVIILLFTHVPIKHVVPKDDIISMFTVAYAFLYIDVVRSLELVVYLFFY